MIIRASIMLPLSKLTRACGNKSSISGASKSFLSDVGARKKIREKQKSDMTQTNDQQNIATRLVV